MVYITKPEKVSIYINTARKTAAQVKVETGCDAIINGGLFNMCSFAPVCNLKADGKVLATDPYKYWGYGWNDKDLTLTQDYGACLNYICCVCMVRDAKPEHMYYTEEVGGARQRTAIGVFADGRIWLYCGTDPKTPEELQGIALASGVDSAVMLDGGGSTQGIFPEGTVSSGRIVHNFICVWENAEMGGKSMKVCIDAGHGGNENTNTSPDKTYYEHEFTLDMAKRVRDILTPYVDVVMTREADTSVSLGQRAAIANDAKADIFVSIHSNAANGGTWSDVQGLCIYTYAEGGKRDELASKLLGEFEAGGVKLFGSGLYHSKFTVLANTVMPAVLIEYGFHTNREEAALLGSGEYRTKLADLTAKGILNYFGMEIGGGTETDDKYLAAARKLIDNGWGEILIAMAEKL